MKIIFSAIITTAILFFMSIFIGKLLIYIIKKIWQNLNQEMF